MLFIEIQYLFDKSKNLINFVLENAIGYNVSENSQRVSIVQWIEYRIPVPTIRVRLPMEILRRDRVYRLVTFLFFNANSMDVRIEEGWKKALAEEFNKDYFKKLTDIVRAEYQRGDVRIFPPASQIFSAFNECPYDKVKVVIIGQDPYHGFGQAHGLCFSVNPGVAVPPSLRNIFKEIHADIGAEIPADGNLTRWANQGVLLLNSALTVREHQPKSHSGIGWEAFAQSVVEKLNRDREGLVFILWGSDAIAKGRSIDRTKHLVLESVHPSPLSASRGFFGNHHFSRTNEYLISQGKEPIKW